mmetsp:Transcript_20783/g.42826  ORF Transcript_20783/g.42826 Transcript_20783/m.42826 type:complete len:99 (+) Transcript_20783:480-776(+)
MIHVINSIFAELHLINVASYLDLFSLPKPDRVKRRNEATCTTHRSSAPPTFVSIRIPPGIPWERTGLAPPESVPPQNSIDTPASRNSASPSNSSPTSP